LQGNGGHREAIADYEFENRVPWCDAWSPRRGTRRQVTAQVWAQKIFIFGGGLGADFKQIHFWTKFVTEVGEEI